MSLSDLHAIVANAPDLRPSTRAQYLRDLNTWIRYAGEDPSAWTRVKMQDFYNHLLERMKPQSANRIIASIRYASHWRATQLAQPDLHFAVLRKAKAQPRSERRALSAEDAHKLLATCKHRENPADLRDFAILVLGLETGMRRMSMVAARVENMSRTYGYPTVAVPLKGHQALYNVPLSDTAVLAMEPWLAWLRVRKVPKGPLFRSIHRRLTEERWAIGEDEVAPQTFYDTIGKRAEAAGLGHVHPHILRHTFVTWRLDQGLTPHQISAITGHRLPGDGLGNIARYGDLKEAARTARLATPAWLATVVRDWAL